MIIHISRQRFESILAQGHRLTVLSPDTQVVASTSSADGVEYHLLDGDHALCCVCDEEHDSVPVNTPTDLEVVKTMRIVLPPDLPWPSVQEMQDMVDGNLPPLDADVEKMLNEILETA